MSQFLYLFSDSIYNQTHTNYLKNGLKIAKDEIEASHLVNEKKGKENYYNLFTLYDESAKPLDSGFLDFTGYQGNMRLAFETLPLDFDSKDNVKLAFDDVKRFISDFKLENYQLFYSGAKGFHLYIHRSQIPSLPEMSKNLNKLITDGCIRLKANYKTLDTSIYTAVRKFRSPLSLHPKSKAFKVYCSIEQELSQIQDRAKVITTLGSWAPPAESAPNEKLNEYFKEMGGLKGEDVTKRYEEFLKDHQETPTEDAYEELTFIREFNSVVQKPCIQKMLATSYKSGDRHEVFLRILWTLLNAKISDAEVTKIVTPFMKNNNFEERQYELRRALDERRSGRNKIYMCKDTFLAANCQDSCPMFHRLSLETKAARTHALGFDKSIVDLGYTAATEQNAPKDKSKSFSEYLIATAVLNDLKAGGVIKQDKDVFTFEGTHWVHMKPDVAKDFIIRKADAFSSYKQKYKDLAGIYQRVMVNIPTPPEGVDMFQPNPFRITFKNGTLHIDKQPDGSFTLSLRPHNKLDYSMVCHPFDYEESAPEGVEFEATLKKIWGKDKDFAQKRDTYFEILGAALGSAFTKIVFFLGNPGSGKSTLIGVATQLVHKRYLCTVSPADMSGFNMEGMVNKLVNFDTDLTLTRPIKDDIVKKIEDRMPIRVSRKGFSDVYTPIPAIHLFGMNKLPKNTDGVEAYERRVTILKCNDSLIADENYVKDYYTHLWKVNGSWIVAKAIEGLKRLAANGGRFTKLESSKEQMAMWKSDTRDEVELFLEDIQEHPVWQVVSDIPNQDSVDFRGDVPYKYAWLAFKKWLETMTLNLHSVRSVRGENTFNARLRELGAEHLKTKGVNVWRKLCKNEAAQSPLDDPKNQRIPI